MKNTARKAGKTTASKTTASKTTEAEKAKEAQPMDASISEARVGTPSTNNQRPCWAIKTLNEEVWSLFPETPVEYSNFNGRNTALDVTYDLTAIPEDERALAGKVIALLAGDARVADVVLVDDSVLISMHPNPRTQDSREPFGLANAHAILTSGEDDEGWTLDVSAEAAGSLTTWDGGDAFSTSSDVVDGGGA